MQEWYLLAFQHADLFNGTDGPMGKIARCLMMRVCGRQAQRGKRRHASLDADPQLAGSLPAPVDRRFPDAVMDRVKTAVKSLELDLQAPIVLRYYLNFRVGQIASELALPAAEVRRRL